MHTQARESFMPLRLLERIIHHYTITPLVDVMLRRSCVASGLLAFGVSISEKD